MKMKKIICSLMISVLCFMTAISGVSAANTYPTANIDTAVQRAINFYKGRTLESPDEVFAAESLGVEVEDQCDISELLNAFKEVNYNEAKLGDLSKTIITLALTKNDTRNFNNYNLVEILENKVKEDGSIEGSNGTNYDIWVLFALETVSSSKVDVVADKLSTQNNIEGSEGAFWYAGPYTSEDVTGWGIEALTIANKEKYQASITSAIKFLESKKQSDGSYGDWGANADTQGAVIEGLLTYDREGVLNGKYDTQDANIFKVLIDFQKEDGSVEIATYPTFEVMYNSLATTDLTRCVGTYKNGSLFLKAQKDYDAMVNPVKEEPKTEPTTPVEPKKDTTPTQTTTPAQTDKKATAVKTGDDTNVVVYVSLSMMSTGLFLVLKKEYERAH